MRLFSYLSLDQGNITTNVTEIGKYLKVGIVYIYSAM